MPRNRQISLMGFFVIVATAMSLVVQACPYCPTTDPTLSQKLAASDTACVVKFLESKTGKELSMETSRFQVLKSLPLKNQLKTGTQIVTTFGRTAKRDDLFLMMGRDVDGEMEWNLPIPMDDIEFDYIRKAPNPEQPQVLRLSYFLKYLDNRNPTISNDAFGEFALARFEDVEQLAPQFSREKLRSWLDDPDRSLDVRRAFYGMLLGLCGNDDDAVYLERKVFAPIDPDKIRIEMGGLMGGYLLLRGPAGLKKIIERKVDSLPAELSNDDSRINDLVALRMTLSFLWDFRRSQFTEETLQLSMRRFLKWSQFADQTTVDLARWKDWQPLDELIQAYGHGEWSSESAKEKIIKYALACRKDAPKAPGAQLPAHAVRAQKFLDSLDPELVQSVKDSMGGPLPLPKSATKASTPQSRDELDD